MNCDLCNREQKNRIERVWRLRDYYGLTGTLCDRCYERVRHDSYGSPFHPVMYRNALKALVGKP